MNDDEFLDEDIGWEPWSGASNRTSYEKKGKPMTLFCPACDWVRPHLETKTEVCPRCSTELVQDLGALEDDYDPYRDPNVFVLRIE